MCKDGNGLFWPTTFSPVSSLGNRSRGSHPASSNSKGRHCCDAGWKHCAAQNFSSQWWISCSVERNRARNSSQPAMDIISSHLSQAGIAGQVYLRIISLQFLNCPWTSMQVSVGRRSWLDVSLERRCLCWWATMLLGSQVMLCWDIPLDLGVIHPRVPPAAGLMAAFVGAGDGLRELES